MSERTFGIFSAENRISLLLCSLVFAVVFVISLATPGVAQVTTATVVGTVTDRTGATVGDAQATIVNTATNQSRTVTTDSSGGYRFDLLPIGPYVLNVTGSGFKKFVQQGIVLTVGQSATINVTLDIGSLNETVNVTGAPPTVNTSNAEIGATIDNQQIVNLPLVNRNAYTLLEMVPGYQSGASSLAATTLGFEQQITFINGGADGNGGSVAYFMDGGVNMTGLRNTGNAIPSPDAIEEFRVQTNSFSAIYGRTNGTIVNVVTKSGTNSLHGSLFEFVRNTSMNANTFDSTSATPPFHRNQFGGTVGGPIRKNKLFFFASYDGLRQITPNFENNVEVPFGSCGPPITATCTATLGAERVGNFNTATTSPSGATATPIKDPIAGGAPFTNNQIPANMLDPAAAYIIANYIPIANELDAKDGRMDFWTGYLNPSTNNYDEGLGKISYQLTDNQKLEGDYFIDEGATAQPAGGSIQWGTETFAYRQQNIDLSHTWTISANKINQGWLSYTRNIGGRIDSPATGLPANSLTAITAAACATTSPFYQATPCSEPNYNIQGTPDLASISVTGGFSLGEAISGPKAGTDLIDYRDVFGWTRGRHAFSIGGEVGHDLDEQKTLLDNYGVFTFGNGTKNSGNNFSDFDLGLDSAQEQDAPVTPYTASYYYALFFQDDLRVTSRFTANLGLRWSVQTPPTDSSNLGSIYVPGKQSTIYPTAPLGELVVGDPGVSSGLVSTRYHHFEPRIGLAYDPTGNGKTAIRAGFGVFYGMVSGNEWNTTSNFEPFAVRLTPWPVLFAPNDTPGTYPTLTNPYNGFTSGTPPTACIPFPFPQPSCGGSFTKGGSIYGPSSNFQWPYTYQMNLSLQHEFRGGLTLGAAYVGNLSHDLPFANDVNYPTVQCGLESLSTFSTCRSDLIDRRPIDNTALYSSNTSTGPGSPFGQVLQLQSNQFADYHSFQLTFAERLGQNLTMRGYYVYSKTLDTVDLDNTTDNPGDVQDNLDLAEDRGPASQDIRDTFALSIVWTLNYYRGESGALRYALNGWTISPIITARSGLPFSVVSGADENGDGITTDRATLTGQPVTPAHRFAQEWFNTGAFCLNNGAGTTAAGTLCPAGVTGVGPGGADGNSIRDGYYGPGSQEWDLSAFRDFRIHEDWVFQFRAEALNVFNHPNLSNPGGTVGTSTFGVISGAGTMREIQLGGRLTF